MRNPIPLLIGLLVMAVMVTGCTAPAYNDSQYKSKVAATTTEAASAVEVVRLALREEARHELFDNPVDVAISNAEDTLGEVSGTFSLVQPPTHEMDVLRAQVEKLLDEASSQLETARIAFRQGDLDASLAAIAAATEAADKLDRIGSRY